MGCRPALGGVATLALMAAAAGCGAADEPIEPAPFTPAAAEAGDRDVTAPARSRAPLIALVTRSVVLHARPGGKPKVRIDRRTTWDTERRLGVVRQRGEWLAVSVPELRNGELGWLRERDADEIYAARWSVRADLSQRRVVVRRGGRVVRTFGVGVGRPGHSTPTGRFAVTDRLKVTDPASPYGCCVLALSGHQTRLPAGWPGGDRLAIHATADRSGIGREVSLGCLRADPRDARWLIRQVPVGTPVYIRT